MRVADFMYDLPPERIAREPARPRDSSRLLVLDRSGASRLSDSVFLRLADQLRPDDVVVLNNTRVLRARLFGRLRRTRRSTGTAPAREIEVFFSHPLDSRTWAVLVRPGRRIRPGDRIDFGANEVTGEFGPSLGNGLKPLTIDTSEPIPALLGRLGQIPIPPYLQRPAAPSDEMDYQTVFAKSAGAVAAPTAGLHFTEHVFETLRERGVQRLEITLHTGLGTFMPVRTDDPVDHVLLPEWACVDAATARALNEARRAGRRIVAVGTTVTRTLESVMKTFGEFREYAGETDLFILPGHTFRAIDGLLTNFHLPGSTLLMLVCAFAGRERILDAYRHAVAAGYRFYSYGDAMLIL